MFDKLPDPPKRVHPALIAAMIIGALIIVGAIGSLLSPTQSSDTAPSADASQPTPRPAPVTGAYLGGEFEAFVFVYGQPDANAHVWSRVAAANGLWVRLSVGVLPASRAQDGMSRVGEIVVTPADGGSWTRAQADAIMNGFFPDDAAQVGSVKGKTGTIPLYRSAELAVTFIPSAFTDASGKHHVTPGDFDYACSSLTSSKTTVDLCDLGIGE